MVKQNTILKIISWIIFIVCSFYIGYLGDWFIVAFYWGAVIALGIINFLEFKDLLNIYHNFINKIERTLKENGKESKDGIVKEILILRNRLNSLRRKLKELKIKESHERRLEKWKKLKH